jgi:hypothetical protein
MSKHIIFSMTPRRNRGGHHLSLISFVIWYITQEVLQPPYFHLDIPGYNGQWLHYGIRYRNDRSIQAKDQRVAG